MRRIIIAGTAALALLGASPAIAADAAGFYAGIYAGIASRNSADFDFSFLAGGFGDFAAVEHPVSIVNDGVDPQVFDALNRQLAKVPYADAGAGEGVLGEGSLSFDPSTVGGIVFGYGLGNGVRVEADLSAATFAAGDVRISSGLASGAGGAIDDSGIWTWTSLGDAVIADQPSIPLAEGSLFTLTTTTQFLLVNAWYDFDTGTAFTPYLGGGAGLARVSTRVFIPGCSCDGGDIPLGGGSTIVPAAEIGGGLRVKLADPVTLDLGYRYKVAFDPSLSTGYELQQDNTFLSVATSQSGTIGVQTVQAGLTFALE